MPPMATHVTMTDCTPSWNAVRAATQPMVIKFRAVSTRSVLRNAISEKGLCKAAGQTPG